MSDRPPPEDQLWKEYALAFRDWDDLTLARWLAQTLGQLAGKSWRASHPLVAACQLGAQLAHDRQIWFKRLATPPTAYHESPCCRAPMLPLLTRDVKETGLICQHCNETLVPFDELPGEIRPALGVWSDEYSPIHQVAHWDEARQKSVPSYDRACENAAQQAERMLAIGGYQIAPQLLDFYAAIIWEDHDECLEVRPEDIREQKNTQR
jgi:hypothetical protein